MERSAKLAARVLLFALAVIVTGLGVALMKKSDLALGPWNTTDANLSLLSGEIITLGMASQIHTFAIITLVVVLNGKLKYYLSLITTLLVGWSIDFWNLSALASFAPSDVVLRFVILGLGFLCICVSLALIVVTRFPAMVFDELTLSLSRLLRIRSFPAIRIGIEALGLLLAIVYGLIGQFGFGTVNLGAVALAFMFGPAISFFIKQFQRLRFFKDPR